MIIIGLGGIGTCLYPQLYQYLQYRADEKWEVILMDGDYYELKNAQRQFFGHLDSVGKNKAQVLAELYIKQFPQITFSHKPMYITEQNTILIREGDIVLMGVDNHATRKLVSDCCSQLKNITLISGGNELTTGDVLVYVRRDGKDLTVPFTTDYNPEIRNPQDHNPGDVGCEDLVESAPQLLPMNLAVATAMIGCLDTILSGATVPYSTLYLDLRTGNARAVKRS